MKTINPKCTNEDSFKYSILTSLHCYVKFIMFCFIEAENYQRNGCAFFLISLFAFIFYL